MSALSNPVPIKLEGIEALRAIAATMIVIFHTVELSKIAIPDSLVFIRSYFGLGVPLFYVLSGFVLAYGYGDKLNDRAAILRFYLKRFFRIAPLFYAMLIVWLAAGWWKWEKTVPITDILLNISFTFGLVPGKHESIVWAGWSIGVEMIFYLIFPVVSVLIAGVRSGIIVSLLMIFVSSSGYSAFDQAGLGSFSYMNFLTHLPFFLAGTLAYRIWESVRFQQNNRMGAMLFIVAAVIFVLAVWLPVTIPLKSPRLVALHRDILGVAFMFFVLSVSCWPNRLIVNRPLISLGRVSFSLYLLHPFVIVIFIFLDVYKRITEVLGNGYLGFSVCIITTAAVLIPMSMASFKLIEKPGMSFGKQIAHMIR